MLQLQDVSLNLWNVYSKMDPMSLESLLSEVRSLTIYLTYKYYSQLTYPLTVFEEMQEIFLSEQFLPRLLS